MTAPAARRTDAWQGLCKTAPAPAWNLRAEPERCAIFVRGLVQGVGFRPFVSRLATGLGLGGLVRNCADGVRIEVEGRPTILASFMEQLRTKLPPLARIEEMDVAPVPPRGELAFVIEASESSGRPEEGFISPDVSTCAECRAELLDPCNRRYRHPFSSCTQCGPRLTILNRVPYDRERTTMALFAMCDACRAEYEDSADRRFHAQPIACPSCGPRLAAHGHDGQALDAEPLPFFKALLQAGRIVAVKGIGGYHLACDATSQSAVERLRARKLREEKPFAVMVSDLEAARQLCDISAVEAELLCSPRGPIVLLRRRRGGPIAEAVAPNSPWLGLMLPNTPLHHLLVGEAGRPIVLTSGNRSEEPIACADHDALTRLRGVADGFVTHDRAIELRCDDSVIRVMGERPLVIRRSRGYVPEPIRLPLRCTQGVLALGGQLKNTFALGRRDHAILSHHLGDLGHWTAYRAFRDAITHYETLFAFRSEVLVHDLHPGYATTEYARERQAASHAQMQLIGVQHHHAHMASCMAENGLAGPAIGVVFDGIGYGTDGSLWGGEFLVGDYRNFRRVAHLRAVPLPGGERAIREPWRMALAFLLDCGEEPERFVREVRPEAVRVVRQMIAKGVNAPLTTSMGRLFDAVASLLGLRAHVSFEGQAAIELEGLAESSDADDVYPFLVATDASTGSHVVDTRPLVQALVAALRNGDPAPRVARQFHNTVTEIIARVTTRVREESGIHDVVLSGGVFQNALLLGAAKRELERLGFDVHTHSRVPPNDGGLCLGQLAVAAAVRQGGS